MTETAFAKRYKAALQMIHEVRPMSIEPFAALLSKAEYRAILVGIDMGAIRQTENGYVVPSLWPVRR
jgi:hypothetical protein